MKRITVDPKPPISNAMLPSPYRIRELVTETRDTFTLTMCPAGGGNRFPFEPGQFNMVYMFGVGEVPISMSGDPARTDSLVHTIRSVGSVTTPMRDLKPGDVLGIRGPFGSHWPLDRAKGNDLVIVAGGLGMAPLRPVLYHVLANRQQYGRVALLYGARRPADILYLDILMELRRQEGAEVHLTVDIAAPDWRWEVGVVTRLISKARFDPLSTTAMVCGPEIMMRYVVRELADRGVASDEVFVSMERNMKCGAGLCGHCQFGRSFVCKDGPVFPVEALQPLFGLREV